ncbi:MAG: FtsX-like permease family protein [Parcubacteria group bacterium]|jgi:putative ABC transport system permease protein
MSIISKIKNSLLDRAYRLFGKEREDIGVNMQFSVITLISWRNIAANKIRSFLTIGGVGIGIGIITFLISLGFGIQEMVIREITKNNPSNVVEVSNGSLENLITLNDETMEKIRATEGVTRVERAVNIGVKFYSNDTKIDSVLYGYTRGYMEMANVRIKEGSTNFSDTEEKVFVTPKLAQLMGYDNPADIIGKTVQYEVIISEDIINKDIAKKQEKEDIEIAGLINDDSNKNTSLYAVTMYDHLKEDFGLTGGQAGKVEVNIQADLNSIRSRIEQMGFSTESISDTVTDVNSFFNVIKIVMVVFGTIIMSISAMGMLNTLSVSLLQRTREVGILKALGAKRADVFKMFIFEAAIISFSGGILGFSMGYGAAKGANAIFNYFAKQRGEDVVNFISVPMYFVIAIVAFVAFLGFATGIMPARRASKTHALDALRYE